MVDIAKARLEIEERNRIRAEASPAAFIGQGASAALRGGA